MDFPITITRDQARIIIYLAENDDMDCYPFRMDRELGISECKTRLSRMQRRGVVARAYPTVVSEGYHKIYYELTDLGWKYYWLIREFLVRRTT